MAREDVVDQIGSLVHERAVTGRPTRVAVEGITASGKTTWAADLVAALEAGGRPATHVSMDGFHHPAAHRRRQGPMSADGYYEDAYDLPALRRCLLDPLGPGGDRSMRTAVIDLASDRPVDPSQVLVAPNGVVVVDGSFLARPEVADGWDVRVWLEVSFEVALTRGVARDAELLGGEAAARSAFTQRYHAAFRRYLAEVDPAATADVVIDNTDPTTPLILRP